MAKPVVTTVDASSITGGRATFNANLTYTGGLQTSRRFKWGRTTSMTEPAILVGTTTTTGTYSYTMTGLLPNTTYYFQAVAINEDGEATGARLQFTTLAGVSVTTVSAISVTHNGATIRGNLTSTGGLSTTRYFKWGSTVGMTEPTINKGATTTTGAYSHSLTGLSPNTTYYFKATATNADATNEGDRLSFTTASPPVAVPTVSTDSASSITRESATITGSVSSDGGATATRYLRWGPTTSMTTVINKGTGTGSFSESLSNLSPNTTYYYEAYATNSAGSGYGGRKQFTTSSISTASVSTTAASGIGYYSATIGGRISDTGGNNPLRYIEWGYSSSNMPWVETFGAGGVGNFSTTISVSPNTTYYFRAYATNSAGSSYGDIRSFKTLSLRPVEWSWTSSELSAFNNQGIVTALTAARWNAFVDKVNEFRAWKARPSVGGKGTSGGTFTAAMFNTVKNGINDMAVTGIANVASGDVIYGSYFVTLAAKLNSIT